MARDSILRVARGGSFDCDQKGACCTYRVGGYPNRVWNDIGFRIVVSHV